MQTMYMDLDKLTPFHRIDPKSYHPQHFLQANPRMATQEIPSDIIITLPNNITVRRYRVTDAEHLARHANNKAVWMNLRNRIPYPYTVADSETWISLNHNAENWIASGPYTPSPDGAPGGTATGEAVPVHYAVCVNDEAAGSIGFDFGDPNEIYARNAEIGYWLSEDQWGKGIMGRVAPAFVEWGWKTFERLVRINGLVYERNVASRRCLEKAGLVLEGRRKMGLVKNGVFGDEVIMGMLRPGMDGSEAK